MTRTVFAPLHFQRDICLKGGLMAPEDPEALARFAAAAAQAAKLARAARDAGVPVLHIAFGRPAEGGFANPHGRLFRWITQVGGCIEGSEGYRFVPELSPEAGDIVLSGNGTSGFTGSGLAAVLDRIGAGRIVLGGITTHWAVESTAREASERGLACVVAADCCAAASKSTHDGALERLSFIATVAPSDEIAAQMMTARG